MSEIQAICYEQELAITDDGLVFEITDWIGSDGEECEPLEAVKCVAGTDEYGWHIIDLTDFMQATVH